MALRRACIDIGSNTTRLLVADCDAGELEVVHETRSYTRIGRGVEHDGAISAEKILEVSRVVAAQLGLARELGAEEVLAVATAAIRRARNGATLAAAVQRGCGLPVQILTGEAEARLAFLGAARTLGHEPLGSLGVVDVGGGSSEIVIGLAPDAVSWCRSFGLGSGDLAERCLHSDPPAAAELEAARREVELALAGIEPPHPAEAVAVGGSASSLRRLVGPRLDREAFTRSLRLVGRTGAAELSRLFALEPERARLLPAGLLILQAVSERFGTALQIGHGGLREGVLLQAAAGG